jgi:tetratricopeptide (TPR) repeat protein
MTPQRTVFLTPEGLQRIETARRRLGISLDALAMDPETPSANTIRKALRGEPVFVRTVDRIEAFLSRRAANTRQPFERLREGDDWRYAEPQTAQVPPDERGWISRHVPPPNRLFTGRSDILQRLHHALCAPTAGLADPQALTGLGGMGKTQTALAYLYAYRDAYRRIFWANVDTPASLDDALAAIALELGIAGDLGNRAAADRARDWFRSETDWLLVLDNADDLEAVAPHFPPRHGGRLLLTTRTAVTVRWAAAQPLPPLSPDDGAALLLRRAGRLGITQTTDDAPHEEREAARALSRDLGGLPLAIGQAGAFLAGTGRSLAALHETLKTHGLAAIDGAADPEHAPVSATLALAIVRMAEAGPHGAAATDLLRLGATLDGESIPESVLAGFGEEAIATACALSLAGRSNDGITIHRLVQEALRRTLSPAEQGDWARRAVEAVAAATPDFERPDWPQVAPLLPQWRVCAQHIERLELTSEAAAQMLYQAGRFLRIRALYTEADAMQRAAVRVAETVYGPDDARLAEVIDEWACLYREQDRLEDAAPLHARAVAISRRVGPPDHPSVAARLHNQALCDTARGDYDQAIAGFREALRIWERHPEHVLYAAAAQTQLGGALRLQGETTAAEQAFRDALALYRTHLDPEHADVGVASNNLAMLLVRIGRADEAEPLFLTALSVSERVRGPEHPETATVLWGLARTRRAQGQPAEAQRLYGRARTIYERTLPPSHIRLQQLREDLAAFQRELAGT